MADWKSELGEQIRERRKDRFWNQDDLSRRAQIHVNSISRYETGHSAPELDVFLRLAAALGKHEFKIGEHIIMVKSATESVGASVPEQLRLEYGREYVFESSESLVKVQPNKSGLVITPGKRTA